MYETHLKKRIYRSRNGMVLGICRGISDYYEYTI